MENMDGWEFALLAAAGYMAVTALVRLMIRHRDHILAELRRDVEKEQRRKQAEQVRQPSERRRSA